MSYQSYLDNIEQKTGKTPNEIIALVKEMGFTSESKTTDIASWLKTELGIGHGHAMAMAGVVRNGAQISDKHVNSGGAHSDPNNMLRLDGISNRGNSPS